MLTKRRSASPSRPLPSGPNQLSAVSGNGFALGRGAACQPPRKSIVADEAHGGISTPAFDGAGIRHIARISPTTAKQSLVVTHDAALGCRERIGGSISSTARFHETSFGVEQEKPEIRCCNWRSIVSAGDGRPAPRAARFTRLPGPGPPQKENMPPKAQPWTRRVSDPFQRDPSNHRCLPDFSGVVNFARLHLESLPGFILIKIVFAVLIGFVVHGIPAEELAPALLDPDLAFDCAGVFPHVPVCTEKPFI